MKNPWMSAWLSAANRAGNTARGHWMNAARREQTRMTNEMLKAWGLKPARKKSTKRKRK